MPIAFDYGYTETISAEMMERFYAEAQQNYVQSYRAYYNQEVEDLGYRIAVLQELSPHEETQTLPKSTAKNMRLLKDMQMDCRDLLLYIFKEQPRVVRDQFFSSMPWEGANSRHRYMREQNVANGGTCIYATVERTTLAYAIRKPHASLTLVKMPKGVQNPRLNYMQALLLRTAYEVVPYAQLVNNR